MVTKNRIPINKKRIVIIAQNFLQFDGETTAKLNQIYSNIVFMDNVESLKDGVFPKVDLFLVIIDRKVDMRKIRSFRRRYKSKTFVGIVTSDFNIDLLELEIFERMHAKHKPGIPLWKFLADIIDDSLEMVETTSKSRILDNVRSVEEIAIRIENVADAIQSLQQNSTADAVDELRMIASRLRSVRSENSPLGSPLADPRPSLKDALLAIANIFDAIQNSRLASIIVAGAVTALVGGTGWSAAACLAVTLGSWHGKDAFIAAVNKLPPQIPSANKK